MRTGVGPQGILFEKLLPLHGLIQPNHQDLSLHIARVDQAGAHGVINDPIMCKTLKTVPMNTIKRSL